MLLPPSSPVRSAAPPARAGRRAWPVAAGTALTALALVAATLPGVAQAAPRPADGGGSAGGASSYVVTLRADPAATYAGGTPGLQSTRADPGTQLDAGSEAVEDYAGHLRDVQRQTAAAVGAEVDQAYALTLDGFSARLTAHQAARLSADDRVLSVQPDTLLHPQSTPALDALGLPGPDGVWARTGGQEHAGEGVVLGDIDTGIAPDNPAFAGAPLGTAPGAEPYRDGDADGTAYRKADGHVFHGACQTGPGFSAADCSTKVIGARYFVQGRQADGDPLGPQERLSPRDTNGHGSHTASTAAGDGGVTAVVAGQEVDEISGVAPAARIAVYKACWDGPDPAVETDDGCSSSDLVAAIEQATADGVDVVNYSIGGSGQTELSPTDRAFLGAASAGVFVAAAAGNSGPDAGTGDNSTPWVTTVGASSAPRPYSGTIAFADGRKVVGASLTVIAPVTAPLVLASAASVAGASSPAVCAADSLDPARAAGRIVVCDRGVTGRVEKSAEVRRAGGVGMVLVNTKTDSADADSHSVPTVHVDVPSRQTVLDEARAGATATMVRGNTTGSEAPAPQIAGFSSRGPASLAGGDVLKPDVAAPGVAVLAATADTEAGRPTFGALSGTSMAAPHVAGSGLLYLGEHPQAAPAEIKSALMTTARDTADADGHPVTDPFAQGAGEIQTTRYLDPGLLYLAGHDDWARYVAGIGGDLGDGAQPRDPSELNLPSIAVASLTGPRTVTRTVTATRPGRYTASVQGLAGVHADVVPATLAFTKAGQTRSFTVRLSSTSDAEVGRYATGSLTWTGGDTTVRSPIAVRPVPVVAPGSVSGSGTTGAADVTVTAGSTGTLRPVVDGLVRGVPLPDPTRPGSGESGRGEEGEVLTHRIHVDAGERALVVDVHPTAGTTDLDLTLDRVAADGSVITRRQSGTESASERITVLDPEPGDYVAQVLVFGVSTAGGTGGYVIEPYHLRPGAGEGAPSVRPESVRTVQGEQATFQVAWDGLAAGPEYLGLVSYGPDASPRTLVDVTTAPSAARPVAATSAARIEGTPIVGSRLTADVGTWAASGLAFRTRWLSDGKPIPGADDAAYQATAQDVGRALTAEVTATAPDGVHGVSVTQPMAVRFAPRVSVTVTGADPRSGRTSAVAVRVASRAPAPATGTVTVSVDGQAHDVVLDAQGTARLELADLAAGSHPVQAAYAGDAVVAPGTSPRRQLRVIG